MADPTAKPALARAIVGCGHIRVTDEGAPVGKPRPDNGAKEPRVEIIRDGNLIRALDIICSCGEKIRVRLDYE